MNSIRKLIVFLFLSPILFSGKKILTELTNSPTLTHLVLGELFRYNADNLPPNITNLTFGVSFDLPLLSLPKSLTHLVFGRTFNNKIQTTPPGLILLTFGAQFNRNDFPYFPSLTHLTFGDNFNQTLPNLPKALTHLTFGKNFNNSLSLPASLIHLRFGDNFNHPLTVPPHLTHLYFGCKFTSVISPLFQHSLSFIKFIGQYFGLKIFIQKNSLEGMPYFQQFSENDIFVCTLQFHQYAAQRDYEVVIRDGNLCIVEINIKK
jgi:hypothetical protein